MAEEVGHEGVADVDATVDDVDCSGSFVGLSAKERAQWAERERKREIWFFNLVEYTVSQGPNVWVGSKLGWDLVF